MFRNRWIVALVALALAASACICNPLSWFSGSGGQTKVDNKPVFNGVSVVSMTTAKGIDGNGCPVAQATDFHASEDIVYAVAKVRGLRQNTALFARWVPKNGKDSDIEDSRIVTADRQYSDDVCVNFDLQPLGSYHFKAGQYTVTLFINGDPAQSVNFNVK